MYTKEVGIKQAILKITFVSVTIYSSLKLLTNKGSKKLIHQIIVSLTSGSFSILLVPVVTLIPH